MTRTDEMLHTYQMSWYEMTLVRICDNKLNLFVFLTVGQTKQNIGRHHLRHF